MDSVVPISDERGREFKEKKLHDALEAAGLDVPDELGVQELGYILEEAGLDHDRFIVTSGLTAPKQRELKDAKEPMVETAFEVAGPEYRTRKIVEWVKDDEYGAPEVLQHAFDFAQLSSSKFGARKAKLKEELGSKLNLNDFAAAVRDARVESQREQLEGERPVIVISGRQSRGAVEEAKTALDDWNDPPTIFQRGTDPVCIEKDDRGRPVITELPDAALDSFVHDAANFVRESGSGVQQTDLPKRHVHRIRETADFPPLGGIVEVPVIRQDGSFLTEPGYDEASGLYFEPAPGLDVPAIPSHPSQQEIDRALDKLCTPLQDFPFVGPASPANALALMLTPIIRPALQGNVPMALVDATVRGTGKTLLVSVISIIATGRPAATMKVPGSDEEWRKQITAQLLRGSSMIVVDNVQEPLQSAALEQALTTAIWQDRVLGKSKQVSIPQRATWVATGNNISPGGDMIRRVYSIRMDAEMERPWTGRNFAIPNLQEWAREHRGELVGNLLILAQAWFAAGQPDPSVEPLGSFEQWTRVVGGILEHAGVQGFLYNLEDLYETADSEAAEWARFLEAIESYLSHEVQEGEREDPTFTSKELSKILRDAHDRDPKIRDRDLAEIITHLPGHVLQKLNRGDEIHRTLGNMFGDRRGRRFGPDQHRIEVAFTRSRVTHWIVRSGRQADAKDNGPNEPSDESSESSHTSEVGAPPPP